MSNRALLYTNIEGGIMNLFPLEVIESDLDKFTKVVKKKKYSDLMGQEINTRLIKIKHLYIKALFFEDGSVYDVDVAGFKKRIGYDNKEHIYTIYNSKLNAGRP